MSDTPLLPGLVPSTGALLDERRRPDFRDAFGALARRATAIRTAVTRVRLTTLDLSDGELAGVRSFRVVLAELNALTLDAEARTLARLPHRAAALRDLTARLESGRLEVRAAPLGGWSPDFTVFEDAGGPFAVLAGYHWLERPYPHRGPALAFLHTGDAARLAARRHEEVWEAAHDVGPALWSLLARADGAARRGLRAG